MVRVFPLLDLGWVRQPYVFCSLSVGLPVAVCMFLARCLYVSRGAGLGKRSRGACLRERWGRLAEVPLVRGRVGRGVGYSVLRNSMMATPSMARPIAATMPRDSHWGTSQPDQVMPG